MWRTLKSRGQRGCQKITTPAAGLRSGASAPHRYRQRYERRGVCAETLLAKKQTGTLAAAEAAGAAFMLLLAFAPDFNLIEQIISKIEAPPAKSAARIVKAPEPAVT